MFKSIKKCSSLALVVFLLLGLPMIAQAREYENVKTLEFKDMLDKIGGIDGEEVDFILKTDSNEEGSSFNHYKITSIPNLVGGTLIPGRNGIAISVNGLSKYSGPAIRMLTDDHKDTASYGSSTESKQYRAEQAKHIANGDFDKAMQMDVDDIRDLFGNKYDYAIDEMIEYAESKGYIDKGSVK